MNETIQTILNRKSIRAYKPVDIDPEAKQHILTAAMRSPTAGNMMLYSIIEVTRQDVKDRLAVTCDNQPFIAKAPFVLIFLADYQRWVDYFNACDIEGFCRDQELPGKNPGPGDFCLACCDALIAAQTAVIAAESMGIGSCYIGDIMEEYEIHRELFDLPPYVFPITMVCFGYPTDLQSKRGLTQRFDPSFIHFKDTYRRIDPSGFESMFEQRHRQIFGGRKEIRGAVNVGQYMYRKKYTARFTRELNRSVSKIMDIWFGKNRIDNK